MGAENCQACRMFARVGGALAACVMLACLVIVAAVVIG